jgi:hypothetical protein
MKFLLSGLFAAVTGLAGYTAYRQNPAEFAPYIQRLETIVRTASSPSASIAPESPTYGGVTATTQPSSVAVQPTDYSALLLPHLEAAFAPLDANRGKLSEDPLLRLREAFLRERDRAEAGQAIGLVDRLLAVMREREAFRARLEGGSGGSSDWFFRERLGEDWLRRARELAPPFQHDYADLYDRVDRSRLDYAQHHPGYEPRVAAFHDKGYEPRYEDHWGGSLGANVVHREPLSPQSAAAKNPLEREPYHNPLDRGTYHNPLDRGSTTTVAHEPSGLTTGETHHTPLGVQNQAYVNPFSHPAVTSHPTTVSHPVVSRPVVVAPVTVGGGA